jgi:hypothetical protein
MSSTTKISYFQNKSWNETSRTELLFCAELYILLKEKEHLQKFIEKFGLKQGDYDVSYEVSFYRDIPKIKEYAGKVKGKYPSHRAFDLALFSENDIYIIEAKAQQGFDNEQLNDFKNDKKKMPEIIKEIAPEKKVDIHLWAIISSIYKPKQETRDVFENIITWKDIYGLYGNDIFNHADECYGK